MRGTAGQYLWGGQRSIAAGRPLELGRNCPETAKSGRPVFIGAQTEVEFAAREKEITSKLRWRIGAVAQLPNPHASIRQLQHAAVM